MYKKLSSDKTFNTIEKLSKRIRERFPKSGLCDVCLELRGIADVAKARAKAIAKPLYWLRIVVVLLVILSFIGIYFLISYSLSNVKISDQSMSTADVMQIVDAGVNELVLLGAALFFLVTVESRIKRTKINKALRELRSIAHVIDMHQLTKDPSLFLGQSSRTETSPIREMSPFELTRYLNYCSELLSLTAKVAALYAQSFNDAVVVAAANDLETLTANMGSKIGQKIIVLREVVNVDTARSL